MIEKIERAKEWLMRARHAQRELNNLLVQRQHARERLLSITAPPSRERVSGSRNVHKYDLIAELNDEIEQEIKELSRIQAEAMRAIRRVRDERFRILLRCYYVEMLTLEQTAERMHYNFDYLRKLHREALEAIAPLIQYE